MSVKKSRTLRIQMNSGTQMKINQIWEGTQSDSRIPQLRNSIVGLVNEPKELKISGSKITTMGIFLKPEFEIITYFPPNINKNPNGGLKNFRSICFINSFEVKTGFAKFKVHK